VPGAVDAVAAFWAAGVDTPGIALDPGGRTGGIGVAVRRGPGRPRDHGLASAAAGVDIVGGPVTGHGVVVEWWSQMTGRTIEQALADAADVPPGAGGILVLPYLEGERAPRWNPALRAEIVGIGSSAGPAQVMRAVLEGCAYGLRHIIDDAAREGAYLERLVVAGSPARSALWNQIKADVLGVPVAVPEVTDLASYGDALAAGAAIGWWPPPGDGASGDWPTVPTTTVEPHRHAVYEESYPRWVALGDALVARLAAQEPLPER
jgi:xylulokinase